MNPSQLFTDLFQASPQQLAADRPQQTPEIYSPNDFYGHAGILKQYAGLPEDYALKASVEHGVALSDYVWDQDILAKLPGLFCQSLVRKARLEQVTSRLVFAIGPMIAYCAAPCSQNDIASIKKILGKTLIAFPLHSSHYVETQMEVGAMSERLHEIKAQHFDTVMVCLYWKDILLGRDQEFKKYGFDCITAGHMYDALFLPRLRTIFEIADCTACNGCGTHIGYSIAMGTPYFHIDLPRWEIKNEQNMPVDPEVSTGGSTITREARTIFSDYCQSIGPDQRAFVAKHWGLGQELSAEHMRFLLSLLEDIFQQGSAFFVDKKDVLLEYCAKLAREKRFRELEPVLELAGSRYEDCSISMHTIFERYAASRDATRVLLDALHQIFDGKGAEALEVLQQSIPCDLSLPGLEYVRGIAFVQLQNWDAARKALLREVQTYPENRDAHNLLQQIETQGREA